MLTSQRNPTIRHELHQHLFGMVPLADKHSFAIFLSTISKNKLQSNDFRIWNKFKIGPKFPYLPFLLAHLENESRMYCVHSTYWRSHEWNSWNWLQCRVFSYNPVCFRLYARIRTICVTVTLMCRSVQNYGSSRFMCKGNAFQPTSSMAQKKIEYAQGLFSWMNLKNTSSKKKLSHLFPWGEIQDEVHCTSVIQFSFFFHG